MYTFLLLSETPLFQAHLFLTACSSRFVIFCLVCPWTNRGLPNGSLLPLVGGRVLFGRGGRHLAETIKANDLIKVDDDTLMTMMVQGHDDDHHHDCDLGSI